MSQVRSRTFAALALALAAGLSGCAGAGVTVKPSTEFVGFSRALVAGSVHEGRLPASVQGAATSRLDDAATAALVVSSVRLDGWLGGAALAPGAAGDLDRLVYIFNPAVLGRAIENACGPPGSVALRPPPADRVELVVTFCEAAVPRASVYGIARPEADGKLDVTGLTRRSTAALLPGTG